MRLLAVSALVPGIASLLLLGLGSLTMLIARMLVGPLIYLAFSLASVHLYPTSLGKLHLKAYRLYKWWTGMRLHSRTIRVPIERAPLSVFTIACHMDNYAYLLVDEAGLGSGADDVAPPIPCALVDPSEPDVVLAQLELIEAQHYPGRRLVVEAILTTHKHWDHQGGNVELSRRFPEVRVYGGARDEVAACTHPVTGGDTIDVGAVHLEVIDAPGHTVGSVMFLVSGAQRVLFTGDTMFCGGCGSPMEGTMRDVSAAFSRIWRLLAPHPDGYIFPGHEYTEVLLSAAIAEPGPSSSSSAGEQTARYARLTNTLLRARRRRNGEGLPLPTVPTLLDDELAFNPYFAELHAAASVLADAWRSKQAGPPPHGAGSGADAAGEAADNGSAHSGEGQAGEGSSQAGTANSLSAPGQPSAAPPHPDDLIPTLRPGDTTASRPGAVDERHSLPTAHALGADSTMHGPPTQADGAGVGGRLGRSRTASPPTDAVATPPRLRARHAYAELSSTDIEASRPDSPHGAEQRREAGKACDKATVVAALELFFGAGETHVDAELLVRALSTLGTDEPLSPERARALVTEALAMDIHARAADGAAAGEESPPDLALVSVQALVALLATAELDEAAAGRGGRRATLIDVVVRRLARWLPLNQPEANVAVVAAVPAAAPESGASPGAGTIDSVQLEEVTLPAQVPSIQASQQAPSAAEAIAAAAVTDDLVPDDLVPVATVPAAVADLPGATPAPPVDTIAPVVTVLDHADDDTATGALQQV